MNINLNNYVTFNVDERKYDRLIEYFDNDEKVMNLYVVTNKVKNPMKGYIYLKMQVHRMIYFAEKTRRGNGYIHSMDMEYSEN